MGIELGVMAGMSAIAGAAGDAKSIGAQIDQQRKQKVEIIKQMNWGDAQVRQDQRNLWDQTAAELGDMDMAAIRNRATISAAIGESGMGGRTANAVQRNVEAADLRARSRVTDNYERDYTSLLAAQQENWQGGLSQIAGQAKIQTKSSGAQMLDVLSATVGGYMAGDQLAGKFKTNKTVKPKAKAIGSSASAGIKAGLKSRGF